MPYKHRRRRRRKPVFRRSESTLDKASRALKVALQLKSLLNVERKTHDIATTSLTPTTAGLFLLLNGIANGDLAFERDGSSVKMVRLGIHGNIFIHASATNTQVRYLIVQKKDNNSAAPVLADILNGVGTNGFYKKNTIHNFNILYDKRYNLAQDGKDSLQISFNKELRMKVRYDGTTAAVTDISKNGLYFFCISNEATNTPTFSIASRVTYIDN